MTYHRLLYGSIREKSIPKVWLVEFIPDEQDKDSRSHYYNWVTLTHQHSKSKMRAFHYLFSLMFPIFDLLQLMLEQSLDSLDARTKVL